jgi:type I restriction-modification system DNA methylase subunit
MQCNRTGDHIKQLFQLYHDWRAEEGISTVISTDESARNDYSLSPSRWRKPWCCCARLRRSGVLRTRDWTTC